MVDRSGEVWEVKLTDHKTAHHDKERVIYVGPRAQKILAPYLLWDADAACFSRRESEIWRREKQTEDWVTPLSCGNKPGSNRVKRPARLPRVQYNTGSYDRAVKHVCAKTFPAPEGSSAEEIKAWNKRHAWTPNHWKCLILCTYLADRHKKLSVKAITFAYLNRTNPPANLTCHYDGYFPCRRFLAVKFAVNLLPVS